MDIKLIMENVIVKQGDMFTEITPVEGYVITDWDKEDIMNYNSTTMLVLPNGKTYDEYYTLSVEMDTFYRNEMQRLIDIEISKNN